MIQSMALEMLRERERERANEEEGSHWKKEVGKEETKAKTKEWTLPFGKQTIKNFIILRKEEWGQVRELEGLSNTSQGFARKKSYFLEQKLSN